MKNSEKLLDFWKEKSEWKTVAIFTTPLPSSMTELMRINREVRVRQQEAMRRKQDKTRLWSEWLR